MRPKSSVNSVHDFPLFTVSSPFFFLVRGVNSGHDFPRDRGHVVAAPSSGPGNENSPVTKPWQAPDH